MTAIISMRTIGTARIVAVLAFVITAFHSATSLADDVLPPPYFIADSEAIVIGVAFDESQVRSAVPKGIKLTQDLTGEIVMYIAKESAGLPPYSSSWIGVDIEGFDAPGGAKARWMLTGLYSPATVSAALSKYLDYPTREGATQLQRDGRKVIAIGSLGGNEMIRAELILKDEPCQRSSGLIHEVTARKNSGKPQLIKLPYVADWCAAESAKVDIIAPAGDPLAQLKPAKILWSGLFRGGFGWVGPSR